MAEENDQGVRPRRRVLGLFEKRECWRLTWRARGIVLVLLLALALAGMYGSYAFLAPSNPRNRGILVVEGWLPDYALRAAVDRVRSHQYERVLVPGNVLSHGYYLSEYKDWARLGAASLRKMGLPSDLVVAIEPPPVHRDRTYASGVAVRNWMKTNCPTIKSVDLICLGPHTRRTRLLYEKAFPSDCEIGAIPIQDEDYDPKRWWRTSAGVRMMISEMVAYGYARFLFRPQE